MKITPFFRWYDLWIGIFVDTKNHTLYICPVPTLGVKITWARQRENISESVYRDALHTYGCHLPYCDISAGCTCGLDDLLFPHTITDTERKQA